MRVRAVAGAAGLRLSEVFIYGERQGNVETVGGIYPSWFPPVTGEEVSLRAVIRNLASEPVRDVKVEFRETAPGTKLLGRSRIKRIDACSAKVPSIRWVPTATDPHTIEVSVAGRGFAEASRTEIIPVVNRRLYLCRSHPHDNGPQFANLYTNIGGGFEFLLAKIRGRLGLHYGRGVAGGVANVGTDEFEKRWLARTGGAYRDGMLMDEWGHPLFWPEACEAMRRVCKRRGNRMVVPWLIGDCDDTVAEAFRDTSLILSETYLNWQGQGGAGHHTYRRVLDQRIGSARDHRLLDKWIIAPGLFVNETSWATTLEDVEREVQYLRMCGPEMPGVCFYGSSSWVPGGISTQVDTLYYRYFIAPVVTPDAPGSVAGDKMHTTVRNIGGMTARGVIVVALSGDLSEVGRSRIPMLRPGQQERVTIGLRARLSRPVAAVLPSEQYTALNPRILETIPSVQMRGLPVRVCWTPPSEGVKLDPKDRLEFLDRETGHVAFQLADPAARGSHDGATLHLANLETSGLTPGDYVARIVDARANQARCSVLFTIAAADVKFYVSKVNGEPWTGNPQEVTITAKDDFEVRWDMGIWKLSGRSGIYLSAPGDGLEMPRADGSYAKAPFVRLARAMENITEDPYRAGRWTWRANLEMGDIVPFSPKAWLWHKGSRGPGNERVSMASSPGTWRLWISDGDPPTAPTAIVPVVTVIVKP